MKKGIIKISTSMWVLATFVAIVGCGGGPELNPPAAQPPLRAQNDTGVQMCKNADWQDVSCRDHASQDGATGRDAVQQTKLGGGVAGFDFSRLSINGQLLDDSAVQWSCVLDNTTGLIWEIKVSDSAAANDAAATYTWYSNDSQLNGGDPGIENGGRCEGTACDTASYIRWANETALCNITDWRLPSVTELLSIAEQTVTNPPLDRDYFPNSAYNAYWTEQTVALQPDKAWYVYFTAAGNGHIAKSAVAHIRLVSGETLWR